jgi:hypothetical protein
MCLSFSDEDRPNCITCGGGVNRKSQGDMSSLVGTRADAVQRAEAPTNR